MPLLGLIGFPLEHSFSPEYFREKFKSLKLEGWSYKAFPMETLNELDTFVLSNPELTAFNITIPHKQSIVEHCQIVSEEVNEIGAANLVIIDRNDNGYQLLAFNTDYSGFRDSLKGTTITPIRKAAILGTGGSSKAIAFALKSIDVQFDFIGRTAEITYDSADLSIYDLIINCTPVGMWKADGEHIDELLPLRYETIKNEVLFYDLIYNPVETAMMKRFSEQGAMVKNGLEMLHLQADIGWDIINEFI